MRKVNSWVRMALAVGAVLMVGLPALVSASNVGTSYPKPRLARIVGAEFVQTGHVADYSLFVIYSDGSFGTVNFPPANLTAKRGSVSGGAYTAPGTVGFDLLKATYSSDGGTVVANRVIVID